MGLVALGIVLFFIWAIREGNKPKYKPRTTFQESTAIVKPTVQKCPKPEIRKPAEPVIVKPVYTPPIVSNPTKWFIGEWGIGKPSPAEQLIINELDKYFLDWHREVSFRGLVLPSGAYARFDFWLPDHKLIIEYDSKKWHGSPDRVENDEIKSNFCRNHSIKLIRLHSKHYYKMEQTVYDIMKELGVKEAIYPF